MLRFLYIFVLFLKMTSDCHLHSRSKVCICGKLALRPFNDKEKSRFSEYHTENYDFNDASLPDGVCKRCIFTIRLKRQIKVGFWKEHLKAGLGLFQPWRDFS